MRLLNADTFKLEEFFYVDRPPPYAILSHTWGSDSEEVSYRDVLDGKLDSDETRPQKVSGCCATAKADGYQYVWIDTCCIDKTNSVELQEAINSMFRWYRDAAICYAYLSDVPSSASADETRVAFSASRWFTRGWTLQELLAPWNMRFYNRDWGCIGTKGDLCDLVEEVTGIPTPFLVGMLDLQEASVAQRMSWAANRVTKRQEDIAYCLLGIFGVSMPMIYGEGDKAFRRLQEQIMKDTGDDSILAWDLDLEENAPEDVPAAVPGPALAPSPASFANSGNIRAFDYGTHSSFDLQGGTLRLPLTVHTQADGQVVGFLRCGHETRGEVAVAIPLFTASTERRLDPKRTANPQAPEISWFRIRNPLPTLELVDVHPASCWHKERALIEVSAERTTEGLRLVLARFRDKSNNSKDFILVLQPGTTDPAKCGLMVADRKTALREISNHFTVWDSEIWGHSSACSGQISLTVSLGEAHGSGSRHGFILMLRPLETGVPNTTLDATALLRKLEASLLLNSLKRTYDLQEDKENDLFKHKQQGVGETTARYLLSAIRRKKYDSLERLLLEAVRAAEDFNEQWALHAAVDQRNVDLVRLFIQERGADINKPEERGYTPLHIALANSQEDMVRLLLELGADPTRVCPNGKRPVELAVESGHPEIAELLLQCANKIQKDQELPPREAGTKDLAKQSGKSEDLWTDAVRELRNAVSPQDSAAELGRFIEQQEEGLGKWVFNAQTTCPSVESRDRNPPEESHGRTSRAANVGDGSKREVLDVSSPKETEDPVLEPVRVRVVPSPRSTYGTRAEASLGPKGTRCVKSKGK
ncbi:hypothetical protein VTJ49DRAFT_2343 [Mycothermus thermophilus]|uniref:Heterokaryon incompatibility domain-containing protein n=1 Tax=Humicola insolens TaxID=85995 RepID=A0ABR3VRG7_HUMIN